MDLGTEGVFVQGPKPPSDSSKTWWGWNPINLSTALPAQRVPSVLTPLSTLCPKMLSIQDPFSLWLLLPVPMSPHLPAPPCRPNPSVVSKPSCPCWPSLSLQTLDPGSFASGWVQLHGRKKRSEPKSLSHGHCKWGENRKSYNLLTANHDVHFPHNSDSDKEAVISSDCSRLHICLLPKSRLESSLHKYPPIDVAASIMARRDRRKTIIFPETLMLIGLWANIEQALHWNYLQILWNKRKSRLIS